MKKIYEDDDFISHQSDSGATITSSKKCSHGINLWENGWRTARCEKCYLSFFPQIEEEIEEIEEKLRNDSRIKSEFTDFLEMWTKRNSLPHEIKRILIHLMNYYINSF